ncbi:MAG TPA: DUF2752 domain-containing protein [Verrucomicrobiae bacterium]|nr:DUF2752 domain-containing protein [Verrucomicrobiae bacterium]
MQTPPKISPANPSAIFTGTLLGLALLGIAAVTFFFNPARHGFYPVCLFHKLTGLNCPGCGATRAAHALLHGQFLRALHDNALFVFALALAAIWGICFAIRKIKNPKVRLKVPPHFLWAFLVLALIFGVLRNLPAFAFLSP